MAAKGPDIGTVVAITIVLLAAVLSGAASGLLVSLAICP
jgi:hypothetical protein